MCSRKYNSLYCTNRTSLKTCSMLEGTVYIYGVMEATGTQWKAMESDRREWNLMEPYGSLWKTQDWSIGKLGK